MRKGALIKKILKPFNEKYGFYYKGAEDAIWYFERNAGEITQGYHIIESRFSKELNMRFTTTAYRSKTLEAWDLIPEAEKVGLPCRLGWWEYTTEEEFVKNIEMFSEILFRYGLDALEELSQEDECIPTAEMADMLYDRHADLHDQFAKQYLQKIGPISSETIDSWFMVIEDILKQLEGRSYEAVKPVLLEIAGFLGDELANYAGGEYRHKKGSRAIRLVNLKCYIWENFGILGTVVDMWAKKSVIRCKQLYKQVYRCKLPLTEEEIHFILEKQREIMGIKLEDFIGR